MRWVVFGASSFSGSHLVMALRGHGHVVEERSLRWEIEPIGPCDVVINFSALNVVAPSWDYMQHYIRVNVQQTGALFERLVKDQVPLYIHVSTPEVYGNVSGLIREDQPFNPSTPYAASRAAAEMLLKCYERRYGLRAIVTRACNVFGEGQQHYRLIPKLIASIKKGIKFPLEGGGRSTRAWLHVDNLVTAYPRLALHGKPGKAYHITDEALYSTAAIASMICEEMKVHPDDVLEDVHGRPAQDREYRLDGSAMRALGWSPMPSPHWGIRKTIKWMNENWDEIKDKPLNYEIEL